MQKNYKPATKSFLLGKITKLFFLTGKRTFFSI